MPIAWRLASVHLKHSAFDGEGARLYGGRWNTPGHAAVYLASSRSLAALELLVHLPSAARSFPLCRFEVDIPDGSLLRLEDYSVLQSSWLGASIHPATQQLGDAWLKDRTTLALAVPSAIIPEEMNYLLNPGHPDFGQLKILPPQAFSFDPRLSGSAI